MQQTLCCTHDIASNLVFTCFEAYVWILPTKTFKGKTQHIWDYIINHVRTVLFSAKQNRFKLLLGVISIALKQVREWLFIGYCLSCAGTEMRATEVTVNLPAQFAEDFEQVAGGGTVWLWGAGTAQLGCSRVQVPWEGWVTVLGIHFVLKCSLWPPLFW